MEKIIEWCNLNNGFLTAILSMVGLLLSLTAIVVSVRTALLPFKKKIKISSFVSIAFSKNELTGEVHSEVVGLCVNAANMGFRNANLVYLGILVKDSSLHNRTQKLIKICDEITGTGIITPTEIKSETYSKTDLQYTLSKVKPHAKVLLYATDTEGKQYRKHLGTAASILKKLSAV